MTGRLRRQAGRRLLQLTVVHWEVEATKPEAGTAAAQARRLLASVGACD
jgi:hypothetical protein